MFKPKALLVSVVFSLASLAANADVLTTVADGNPNDTTESYTFKNSFVGGDADWVLFSVSTPSTFTAGIDTNSTVGMKFMEFDLYTADRSRLIQPADLASGTPYLTFSSLGAANTTIDYALKISGMRDPLASYAGYITLEAIPAIIITDPITAAVPEPETYGMMLAGLGLMGFVASRRKS